MQKLSLEKDKIKVLLLEGVHENAVNYMNSMGYTNIEYEKTAFDEDKLIKHIKNFHVVGIRSRTQLTEKVVATAKKLIAVGCFSIGTNQVDLKAAKMGGIPVFNAPFSNTRSVAELVIAECIMLLRGIPEKNSKAHEGQWLKTASKSYEIRGKTLGIIGYGHIGSQVSVLAEAMGMNVIYYDIAKKLSMGNATACSNMEEVLQHSDIVTLHIPSTELTHNLIQEKELKKMKKGACLINASRGEVVDYDALSQAIKIEHLAGAAIDVFKEEPASGNEIFEHPLQRYPNVILTPHIGGSTLEAQANIGTEVSEKLVKYSDTGSTEGAVNFVEVMLQPNDSKQRFLHIHRNLPGVLREVNYVFTSKGINIAAEYLQTDPDLGYVIIDTDSNLDRSILQELKKIPHTIKARLLY